MNPEKDYQGVFDFVERLRIRYGIPGISLSISAAGRHMDVVSGIKDIRTRETLLASDAFECGCLAKVLLAILTLELADRGLVDLDRPISSYLRELDGGLGGAVLVRHLLSHTAGYEGEDFFDVDVIEKYGWDEFVRSFNDRKRLFEPGLTYSYSHSGTVIARMIAERVTGRTCAELVQELVLTPAGVGPDQLAVSTSRCTTGHLLNPGTKEPIPVPSTRFSDFWSYSLAGPSMTPRQWATLGDRLLSQQPPFGDPIYTLLSGTAAKLPKLFGGRFREDVPLEIGLGLFKYANGTCGFASTTVGQTCAVRLLPEERISVAVGIVASAPFVRDYIVTKIMNSLLSEDLPVTPQCSADRFSLQELEGRYRGKINCTIHCAARGSDLVLTIGKNPSIHTQDTIVMKRNDDEEFYPESDLSFMSAGFFRAPGIGVPCLMFGGSAFKKSEC